ncbi:uncharacterized protein GIQ15_05143 [Arthroderma uncinatum]|uniref:uncharacterized protein n=1 Tax=Arthroderma uncinatum TaxID=74035 RepID=UPI00144ACCE2|nr:uncharacterized protein GIQ15_05143 [Arthroderma uncinatum]KAF3482384.1 hypothetical protein GIQ15_05143 [Arthroderma uncinatum]
MAIGEANYGSRAAVATGLVKWRTERRDSSMNMMLQNALSITMATPYFIDKRLAGSTGGYPSKSNSSSEGMDTWSKQAGETTPEMSRNPSPDRLQQRLNRIFDESRTNNNHISRSQQESTRSARAATYSSPCEEKERSLSSSPTKTIRMRPHQERFDGSPNNIPIRHRRSRTDLPGLGNSPNFSIDGNRMTSHSTDTDPSKLEDVDLGASTEKVSEPKSNRTSRLFSGLFQGESSPIRLGLMSSPRSDRGTEDGMLEASPAIDRSSRTSSPSPTKLSRNMNVPASLRQVASGNPFSFFTSKPQQGQKQSLPEPADDKFLNLDIKSALCPPSVADLPPEEALRSFQAHAENLVREFQEAYKLRTFALHGAVAEKDAQSDELEDAQSRVGNIKSQLDGMAARVFEQDKALKALTEELKAEREKYLEESKAKQQAEDVATPTRQSQASHSKQQSSGGTFTSDSGFDSGDESVAESVFSRENDDGSSVNTRLSTVSTSTPSTPLPPATSVPSTRPSTPKAAQAAQPAQQRETAYGRVLKGISSSGIGSSFNALTSSRFKCPDCRANGSSDASTVTSILREENKYLKKRIVELEYAVEECITLVGG